MDDGAPKLRTFKDRIEPLVWLVGSVLVPLVLALTAGWKTIVSPAIKDFEDRLGGKIQAELNAQLPAISKQLDEIKHKISDELDSTYYFTKTYYTIEDPCTDQESLGQFFYAVSNDVVRLFIWSSDASATMQISVNGGPPKSLEQLGERSWTNVDITKLVRESNPLNEEQYPGIGNDVFFISIKPIPKTIRKNLDFASLCGKLVGKQTATLTQKSEKNTKFDVYALLVVRRGPFK